jgi:hypothetical protein
MNHGIRALLSLLLSTVPAFALDHGFYRTTERSMFFNLLKRPTFIPSRAAAKLTLTKRISTQ